MYCLHAASGASMDLVIAVTRRRNFSNGAPKSSAGTTSGPMRCPRYLPRGSMKKFDHSGMNFSNQQRCNTLTCIEKELPVGMITHFTAFTRSNATAAAVLNTSKYCRKSVMFESAAPTTSAQALVMALPVLSVFACVVNRKGFRANAKSMPERGHP